MDGVILHFFSQSLQAIHPRMQMARTSLPASVFLAGHAHCFGGRSCRSRYGAGSGADAAANALFTVDLGQAFRDMDRVKGAGAFTVAQAEAGEAATQVPVRTSDAAWQVETPLYVDLGFTPPKAP